MFSIWGGGGFSPVSPPPAYAPGNRPTHTDGADYNNTAAKRAM